MPATGDRTDELIETIRTKLYTAVVSDVLDRHGYLEQAMDARIRPIEPGMRVIGRAHTVLSADVYQRPANPYENEIAAIDAVTPGSCVVASTNQSTRTCYWGELLSTATRARGGTGCIIDGYTRDARPIIEMGFPVFSTGFKPVDSSSRSTVVDFDVPIECGGVKVRPGDVVFGDIDGIVVIPIEILPDVVDEAAEKVESENLTRDMLRQGHLLREVYDKYGVL
ncbi:MAG TPA: RraA family protein [Thermomicrobiales bacterium]|nr:RraA family protein [Thermomicrobiales bacterium]